MERLTLFNLRQRPQNLEPHTETIKHQLETEQLVRKAYYEKLSTWKDQALRLFKHNHINYLTRQLVNLPPSFEHLDASQPWLAYWMVHALRLLHFNISDELKHDLLKFIKSTEHVDGGFGGGPYQFAHLATTYGAINCLASLCDPDMLDAFDRSALLAWLRRLHQPDGSFIMHVGGEADVRGAYCAIAVAKLTGLFALHPDLFTSTAEWIASCQTYEGGFGAQPGIEAHGGYTFCGVAGLCLMGRPELIDIPRLLRWLEHRQMASEGGFQGRTNKLVDSCYSFWLGAVFPIVEELLHGAHDAALSSDEALFNVSALQEYILLCCQKVSHTRTNGFDPHINATPRGGGSGGLIDKPGKNPDCYHTCYALSGLSVAQHCPRPYEDSRSVLPGSTDMSVLPRPTQCVETLGDDPDNELADLDPRHNISHDGLALMVTYFRELDKGRSSEEAKQLAIQAAENCRIPEVRRQVVIEHNTDQPVSSPEHDSTSTGTCTTP
ncbi:Terpenoid cyclases/protein prenyltransferase alpha-alpha toroid [Paragonimus heterotremus]|uniref:Protein farnesyltransferase subunit beta n=1 Tax=Paragonimus heterotremus TaxID=100268 RepID=A0A8J4WCW0_9TREM|nr:Terpenoid cyclases/protein prenyltransferase alpha-alpha toroid [Paragonimus heterotremus]